MSIQLSEAAVRACFECQTQTEALVALYRLMFPDFDDIDQFDGWPAINDKTWKAIARSSWTLTGFIIRRSWPAACG